MTRKIIDIGVEGNDGTGDSIRESFRKTNENFQELYAVFGQGGQLSLLNLSDIEGGERTNYNDIPNRLLAVNSSGSEVVFKNIVGTSGVTITSNDTTITIDNTSSSLFSDSQPRLSYHLNASNQLIGFVQNPTPQQVGFFNTTYNTTLTESDFAVNKGYIDSNYLKTSGGTLTGYIDVPQGAQGTQAPRVEEVITRSGSVANRTMQLPLFLHDHPGALSGQGTPNGTEDLQAATKYYVDNSSYASTINLFVSTSGSDDQVNTPEGKEGRAWAYAFASIGKACERAEELMLAAPLEPGPYRQLIAYNDGAAFSEVERIELAEIGQPANTVRVYFTNDAGTEVDQANPTDNDIIPGKIVRGRTSGAQGIIYKYYGPSNVPNEDADYFDLQFVNGTFELGENLEFAQPVKNLNITIHVESGVYEEDYPIKIPRNTAIVGDEFRRVLVRPKDRISQSRWVDIWFYRDNEFDELTIASDGTYQDPITSGWWGYHYLSDPSDRNSTPKNNKDIDVFLCNDSTIIRQITCQGHGGFMMVLDPEGQILTKSPYCQQSGSFSGSINQKSFRGGQYVDGFSGNMPAIVTSKVDNFNLVVTGTPREPQLPTSFFVSGNRYKVNAFRPDSTDFENAARLLEQNKIFVQKQTIAYINRTYTLPNFDEAVLRTDIGTVLDAVGFDLALGTNYNAVTTGLSFQKTGSPYLDDWQSGAFTTTLAETRTRTLALGTVAASPTAVSRATAAFNEVIDILTNGAENTETAANTLVFNAPLNIVQDRIDAKDQLQANRAFIANDMVNYIANNFSGLGAITDLNFRQLADALSYDVLYGGNSATRRFANAFFLEKSSLISTRSEDIIDIFDQLKVITNQIVRGVGITKQSGNGLTQNTSSGNATLTEANTIANLIEIINTVVGNGIAALPVEVVPSLLGVTNELQFARLGIVASKFDLIDQTVAYFNSLPSLEYRRNKCERDVGYVIDALVFDLTYGGNVKTVDAARKYYAGAVANLPPGQKPATLDAFEYVKTISQAIVQNTTVEVIQTEASQIKDISNPGEFGSAVQIGTLVDWLIDIVDGGIIASPSVIYPSFQLVLDDTTPLTTSAPASITLLTAGNTSMLSNDWTQVNDLGYGLVANNNGLIETVSVFTYYCWTAYYAKNGGQIRSLNGSNSNGEYALVAEGSDPLEEPDEVILADDMVQPAKIYKQGTFLNANDAQDTSIIITDFQYAPYNISEVEINHGGTTGIVRYIISNINDVSADEGQPAGTILRCNFSTQGNNDTSTSGLSTALANGTPLTIRSNQNFRFQNVLDTNPTRPSTALTWVGDPNSDPVNRVIAYGNTDPLGESLPAGEATLTFDQTFDFARLVVDRNNTSQLDGAGPKTHGRNIGDTKIAVISIEIDTEEVARLNTGQMVFGWYGKVHRIVSYTEGPSFAYITISDTYPNGDPLPKLTGITQTGIVAAMDSTGNAEIPVGQEVTLRAGLTAGEEAEIIVRISTLRATGHDFLDIGTGSYNQSNYPSKIYGSPRDPNQANEVIERSRGRVFYVSTDQDGFFRVGRYFTVDQGTGTVTFSASISLSNLDGIGFKRGVPVAEFSVDGSFADSATDTVPTEKATDIFITRRLGVDRGSSAISEGLIIGPGFLARGGQTSPTADINWAGYKIANLGAPSSGTDAANKLYVDTASTFENLSNVDVTGRANGDFLMYNGSKWVDATPIGDLSLTFNNTNGTIDFQYGLETIVNADISASAAIAQSKLAMNAATTRANATGITQADLGLASFHSTQFNATNGWIEIESSSSSTTGVTLDKIQYIDANSILGNLTEESAAPSELTPGNVVSAGDGIKNASFTSVGAMTVTGTTPNTYGITPISESGAASSLVRTLPTLNLVSAGGFIPGTVYTIVSLGSTNWNAVAGTVGITYNVGSTLTAINSGTGNGTATSINPFEGYINVQGLSVRGYRALEVATTTLESRTPGGHRYLTAVGGTSTDVSGSTITITGEAINISGNLTVSGNISTSGTGTDITAVDQISAVRGVFSTSVQTPLLTTGAVDNVGSVIGNWSLTPNSRFQATYADLAEYYEGDRDYEVGTVLIFGGEKEVTVTNLYGDRRVAGVVSNTGAYIMNKDCPGTKVCIALQGRVPVKVVGAVKKGDILVTSAKLGFAVVNNDPKPGTIIGKSLGNKTDLNEGIIEVAVGRL